MFYSLFDTAFGTFGIVYRSVEDGRIVHILLPRTKEETDSRIQGLFPGSREAHSPKVQGLIEDLIRYLKGEELEFSMDLLDTSVCPPFQLKVLVTDRTIPRGMTASYGWIARKIDTQGVRAVGGSLARNPFPLVVPCHRAIRSDRTLGGFQGGLEMKRALLEMEGVEFDSKDRVHPDFLLSDRPIPTSTSNDTHFSSLIWLV
ncbi:MAG: methylated-DNA--[protein]-cysteine S-methyltransferase [Candidatus Thorarchaeota archaeon]